MQLPSKELWLGPKVHASALKGCQNNMQPLVLTYYFSILVCLGCGIVLQAVDRLYTRAKQIFPRCKCVCVDDKFNVIIMNGNKTLRCRR